MKWLLPFLVLPICFFLSACPQTTTTNVRSVTGSTLQQQEIKGARILGSETNIPLFLSDIKTIKMHTNIFNNGEAIMNIYKKDYETIARASRAPDSWYGSSSYNIAQDLDQFMRAARSAGNGVFSRDNVVNHKSGQDFGFTVSNGNCIYGRWAFNLRGTTHYDNDEGEPDTLIKLDGCGILNDDPQIVFRQIRRMNSTDTAVLATKL